MVSFLYLAFDSESIVTETICSIQSLIRELEDKDFERSRIIIYTNKISLFKKVFERNAFIFYRELNDSIIKKWKGKNKFVLRTKISAMIDYSLRFNDPFIFCDSDTYFLRNPMGLFNRIDSMHCLMHLRENTVGEKIYYLDTMPATDVEKKYDLANFFKNNYGVLYRKDIWGCIDNDSEIFKLLTYINFFAYIKNNWKVPYRVDNWEISKDIQLWNTGVIGLDPRNFYLLEDVLGLCDWVYDNFRYQYSEQLAFALVLGKYLMIRQCEDCIIHYWYKKDMVGVISARLLDKGVNVGNKKVCVNRGSEEEFYMLLISLFRDELSLREELYMDLPDDTKVGFYLRHPDVVKNNVEKFFV